MPELRRSVIGPPSPGNPPRPGGGPGRASAFTLIEVMVTIAIVLVLVAVLLPVIQTVRAAVRSARTATQVQGLYAACEAYAIEDRRHLPPPAEVDGSLRAALAGGTGRTLDLLADRGCAWNPADLGADDPAGRVMLDAWRRPLRYRPDVNMDGVADKPAPRPDWNAKQLEPYPYLWSLGRPAGDEAADADPGAAERWIYPRTSP